jgi:hypothetical protein
VPFSVALRSKIRSVAYIYIRSCCFHPSLLLCFTHLLPHSRNLITMEEALTRASNPDDFRLRVQGIRSSADSARDEMERAMSEFETLGPSGKR